MPYLWLLKYLYLTFSHYFKFLLLKLPQLIVKFFNVTILFFCG